jgi:hypothetical protein
MATGGSYIDREWITVDPQQSTYSFRSSATEADVPNSQRAAFLRNMGSSDTGWDTGHEFWTRRSWFKTSSENAFLSDITGTLYYKGPLVPLIPTTYPTEHKKILPDISLATSSSMHNAGNTAISATLPTKSVSSLTTALAEFAKDGLSLPLGALTHWGRFLENPLFLKDKTRAFREVGSDYLNIQFGWIPFANDIAALLHAVIDSNSIIEQYKRDSGRIVRRSYTFPVTQTDTFTRDGRMYIRNEPNSSNWGSLFADGTSGLANSTFSSTKNIKTWFRGAYTYYIPEGVSAFDKIARYASYAEKLLGLRLTPERLWELAPWSWLVDWFANIQGSIRVSSELGSFSQDGLVLRYGYVMRTTQVTQVITLDGVSTYAGGLKPVTVASGTILKERVAATPFGFGSNPTSWNDGRWAILGALAISKAPKTLR